MKVGEPSNENARVISDTALHLPEISRSVGVTKLLLHLVKAGDIGFLEPGRFGAGEAHCEEDEAVLGQVEVSNGTALDGGVWTGGLSEKSTAQNWAMGNESVHISKDMRMPLPKEPSHGPTVGDRAVGFRGYELTLWTRSRTCCHRSDRAELIELPGPKGEESAERRGNGFGCPTLSLDYAILSIFLPVWTHQADGGGSHRTCKSHIRSKPKWRL